MNIPDYAVDSLLNVSSCEHVCPFELWRLFPLVFVNHLRHHRMVLSPKTRMMTRSQMNHHGAVEEVVGEG